MKIIRIFAVLAFLGIMRCCMSTGEAEKYVKFQDKYSMDWDYEDDYLLRQIAMAKGGDVEDKARTILVTLNRVWSDDYPKTIREVVLMEIDADILSGIIPDKECDEAMKMIMIERIDNSGGSTEYDN